MQNVIDVFLNLFDGGTVILIGLGGLLGKIWVNRVQNNERQKTEKMLAELKSKLEMKLTKLTAKNDKKVHVGKIQYEKEFSDYEDIWKLTSQLEYKMKILNAHKSSFHFYKPEFMAFIKIKGDLESFTSTRYPFIDEGVYSETLQCLNLVHKYYQDLDQHFDFLQNKENGEIEEKEYLLKEKNIGHKLSKSEIELNKLTSKLGDAIKHRNNQMIVVEN